MITFWIPDPIRKSPLETIRTDHKDYESREPMQSGLRDDGRCQETVPGPRGQRSIRPPVRTTGVVVWGLGGDGIGLVLRLQRDELSL